MAAASATSPVILRIPASAVRRWLFGILFALLWFCEFGAEVEGADPSSLYDKAAAGLRWIDVILLAIILPHLLLWWRSRRPRPLFPVQVGRPAILFLVAIATSLVYGFWRGSAHLFFDFRGIILGMGLALVYAYWTNAPASLKATVRLLAFMLSLRIGFLLLLWVAGGGSYSAVATVRTPYFDGPTISAAVLLSVLSLRFFQQDASPGRWAWLLSALLGYSFVLLCMRRTYWGELCIATALLLWLNPKYRKKMLFLLAIALAILVIVAGTAALDRFRSLDLRDTDRLYSTTNLDHVMDLLDAWDHVREHPIMGIGLGQAYRTDRIRAWKTESVMVHNAVLHVWLFYGLLGLASYLWYHVSLLRWLRRFIRELSGEARAFVEVCLAYMAGQFVMPLGFTPWPYGQTQNCLLLAFLLGTVLSMYAARRRSTESAVKPETLGGSPYHRRLMLDVGASIPST